PFDLERGVLDLRVFEGGDEIAIDPVLLFHVHHIAFDGWSLGVLRHELKTLHDAFAADSETAADTVLPQLAIQYGDHAARQSVLLSPERLAPSIEAWRRRLAGLEALELPTDRRPVDGAAPPQATRRRPLSADRTAAVRHLARTRGRTLFTTLLAIFAATLHSLTGRRDFAIGVPEAGRDGGDLDSLMGFFVDMLVLRVDLAGDPDMAGLIERVHETLLEARRHGDVPFEQLVEALSPERSHGNPFFQVAFQVIENSLVSGTTTEHRDDGLTLDDHPVALADAKFDLVFDIVDHGDTLRVDASYAADRFDAATIERWLDEFVGLLDQATADPAHRLSALDLLSADDRALIDSIHRIANPDDDDDHPGDVSLIEQVRANAVRDPDKPAIRHRDEVVPWGELVDRGDALGRRLVASGVHPGTFVGLCVERGVRLIEGMLGILAAGAAYVPLDPAYPDDRLRFMIDDADLQVVLTEPPLSDRLPRVDGVEWVDLTTLDDAPLPEAVTLPRVDGDFPAYVIFTSGSTGKPKGTVVPQRGITRLIVGSRPIELRRDDVLSQITSPSFDASGWEIWGALLSGATVAVIDREDLLEPRTLAASYERLGVNIALITTAYFQQLVRQMPEAIQRMDLVLFGGERCDPEAVRRASEIAADGGPRLINGYGPTECSVSATMFEVVEVADDAVSVPIGPPMARTTCHVVDALGREVGVGVPGELWLGGPGLAHGYHRRSALTAGAFVPDPFGDIPGGRCYRTGDLVRWL
ncbi:MAG: amino acid adenylation domain-containing protein, partial [Acidobacteriota bacterium]